MVSDATGSIVVYQGNNPEYVARIGDEIRAAGVVTEPYYVKQMSYADITQDGVLTVKDDAPIGLVLTVTAVSDDNANIFAQKKVVVTKVKTERVEITNANNFKVTQGLKLTAEIYPSKATDKE